MRQPRRRLGSQVCLLALVSAASPSVSWALLESCNVTATTLPFNVYNPANATATDATGTITVTCSVTLLGLLVGWTISMSPGGSASYATRRLSSGLGTLNYNIYTSAARTTVWGNGSGSTGTISDSRLLLVGSTAAQYTMYGRIPALQNARAGSYSDSIVVTLLY